MLLPALLNILIIGIPYFIVLIFKLRIKYCQKNNSSNIKIVNVQNKIFDENKIEPQILDNSQSSILQNEHDKKQSNDNNDINQKNDMFVVQVQSPILQIKEEDLKQQKSIQDSNEKKSHQELPPINHKQNDLSNSVITNFTHIDIEQNQREQPVKKKEQNQIYSILESYNYQNLINLFLLLSCLTFIQSLVSRYYVMKTKQKIGFPAIFYLSLLNTIISFFYYNIGYGYFLLFIKKYTSVDLEILKQFLILYGLFMTFPIYSGLDNFIQFDSLTLFFAIILMIPLQISVTKRKIFENYPIYFS